VSDFGAAVVNEDGLLSTWALRRSAGTTGADVGAATLSSLQSARTSDIDFLSCATVGVLSGGTPLIVAAHMPTAAASRPAASRVSLYSTSEAGIAHYADLHVLSGAVVTALDVSATSELVALADARGNVCIRSLREPGSDAFSTSLASGCGMPVAGIKFWPYSGSATLLLAA